MKHTKGKASSMHEVRELQPNRWIIGHSSNDSISYYATSKKDAEQTLKEWDAAPELLEALNAVMKLVEDDDIVRDISKDHITEYYIAQGLRVTGAMIKAGEAIKKATS